MAELELLPPSNQGLVYFTPAVGGDMVCDPGDFVMFHDRRNLISRIIRFGMRLRVFGKDRQFTFWNHVALVVDDECGLVEAQGRGVVRTKLSEHSEDVMVLVKTGMGEADVAQVQRFADYVVGSRYGFVTILSLAFSQLTGSKFAFGFPGSFICSGFVAEAQERAGAVFNRPSTHISPADLAKYFAVEPYEFERPPTKVVPQEAIQGMRGLYRQPWGLHEVAAA